MPKTISFLNYTVLILVSFLYISCLSKKNNIEWNTYDIGPYTIKSPTLPKNQNIHGIDSYVGQFLIGDSITIEYDLGLYASDYSAFESFQGYKQSVIQIEGIIGKKISASGSPNGKYTQFSGLFFQNKNYRINFLCICHTKTCNSTCNQITESVRFNNNIKSSLTTK